MNSQSDLYLRGAFEMNPTPTAPGPAAALDTLLRLNYQMQDMPFQYCFIDKPRAGTSAVVFHDPARPHWPSDGIRYLSQSQDNAGSHAGEKFSVTAHSLPNNVAGQVELETGVVTGGIFPPSNPAIPLSKDSPDLQLARYRIRWRIQTPGLGNPALWLVYWGRDERATQRAPAGWEREPIRRYPLPMVPKDTPPQQPLRTGKALPPPPLIEPVYPTVSASPPPSSMQHNTRQPSMPQQRPLPPNVHQQQHPDNTPMYHQQGRQSSMSVGYPPGSSHGMPVQQPQLQQQQQSRRNTPKQTNASLSRKPAPPGLGKPSSGAIPSQSHQAITATTQTQIQALQAIPPHLRMAVGASAAHASFPQAFSDPYDYLSSRSWAGLRYERNHAVIAPIFDPSTTSELIESWIEPSFPDLDKIKEEISLLQKEVEALKARQSQISGKGVAHSTETASTFVTSQQLARKASVANASVNNVSTKDVSRQKDLDALLAPLPRMMPIAEMHDKAMQAHNARRKEIEDALQAQRQAKEEEERIEREKREAEEAARRAVEEQAREKERREREAQEEQEAQRRRHQEEEERAKVGNVNNNSIGGMEASGQARDVKMEDGISSQGPQYAQASQYTESLANGSNKARNGSNANNSDSASNVFGEETNSNAGGAAGNNGTYFDDSYNLLMDNFNMYESGTGFSLPGDEMMEDSLFSEYMDQMGSM